jgi:hypothetical protein
LQSIADVTVTHKNRSWHKDEILEVLEDPSSNDIIENKRTGVKVDLSSLRILLRKNNESKDDQKRNLTHLHLNRRESSHRAITSTDLPSDLLPFEKLPGQLDILGDLLQRAVERKTLLSPEELESDLVYMDALLLKSIDNYLEVMNLPVGSGRRRRLRVLWLPVMETNKDGTKTAQIVPCSPGPTPQDPWICFLECSVSVDVDSFLGPPTTPRGRHSQALREKASKLISEVLQMLETDLPGDIVTPLPVSIPDKQVGEMIKIEATSFIEIPTTLPIRFLHIQLREKALRKCNMMNAFYFSCDFSSKQNLS